MAEGNNVLLGILAVILGILVIAFPLISVFTASILAGLGILFLGIWLLIQSFGVWHINKSTAVADLILGFLAIIVGVGLFGHIRAFSFLASLGFFLAGYLLVISGISSLSTRAGARGKGVGGVGIILGILYIILAVYAWNPFYLAFIIGIWLIVDGIALFFVGPAAIVGSAMSKK